MVDLSQTPRFSVEDAAHIAAVNFGIEAGVEPLPGERDQNFLLTAADGQKFVLKIANGSENPGIIDAQQKALHHLAADIPFIPQVVATADGSSLAHVDGENGIEHIAWVVTYLPGKPMGESSQHSPTLLHNLGNALGTLDRKLANFRHPALQREFQWDLANGLHILQQYASLITNPALRTLVNQAAMEFARDSAPLLPTLPKSAIHNDANDYNILVGGGDSASLDGMYQRGQEITGLLDFGDMVHSYTVGDLAVAIAYAMLNKPEPLAAACQVTKGYHAARPLNQTELAVLYPLARLRLCMSVALAAHQVAQNPGNVYLSISQAAIEKTLPILMQIPTGFAEMALRGACGIEPNPKAENILRWLDGHHPSFEGLFRKKLPPEAFPPLDLGVSSPLMDSAALFGQTPARLKRIEIVFQEQNAASQSQMVYPTGRHGETRLVNWCGGGLPPFSPASTHPSGSVHLGLDVFVQPGTLVRAALAGVVAQIHPGALLLAHQPKSCPLFYTLYRGLDTNPLKQGQSIQAGDLLGMVNQPPAPHPLVTHPGQAAPPQPDFPHLHIQLITELLDLGLDFPTHVPPEHAATWQICSPFPGVLLGLPTDGSPLAAQPTPLARKQAQETREVHFGPNLSLSYRTPLRVTRGWMQYLFDDDGRRYLDAYNNVPHVGHSHPRVVAALRAQAGIVNTNSRYLQDQANAYAARLANTLPSGLDVVYLVASGSEANELALRLARTFTGRKDLLVQDAAYHGHTTTLIDISPYKHNGPGGQGAPGWVHTVPLPDDYRGAFKRTDPEAGGKFAHLAAQVVDQLSAPPAAFIAETFPSVGGQIIPPPGYLAGVYQAVRAAGGLCIADEVQTGFGRVGSHFWAFESQGVTPDIAVLGKPIGNGFPMGAVITRKEIAGAFNNGMEFFSTFGGSTLACAAGMAVLDVLEEENLQSRAATTGDYLLSRLGELAEKFEQVGDIRGMGLFLGVELVKNQANHAPAPIEAAYISNRMREKGVLLGTDGPYHNVLKIRPPMPFNPADADFLVDTLGEILQEL